MAKKSKKFLDEHNSSCRIPAGFFLSMGPKIVFFERKNSDPQHHWFLFLSIFLILLSCFLQTLSDDKEFLKFRKFFVITFDDGTEDIITCKNDYGLGVKKPIRNENLKSKGCVDTEKQLKKAINNT